MKHRQMLELECSGEDLSNLYSMDTSNIQSYTQQRISTRENLFNKSFSQEDWVKGIRK